MYNYEYDYELDAMNYYYDDDDDDNDETQVEGVETDCPDCGSDAIVNNEGLICSNPNCENS